MITLDELMEAARSTAERDRRSLSFDRLSARLQQSGTFGRAPGRFRAAIAGGPVAVIAEVKGTSPVDGLLREGIEPARLARDYAAAGAAAISVLTEETRFGGSLEDLRAACAGVALPVLRKDFVSEPYQVLQAADAGAAAVLLIAEALDRDALRELTELAHELGLDALVEIHDRASLEAAVASGSGLLGVNNRDLSTMRVDPDHALRLAAELPADWVTVAESGIVDRAGVVAAGQAGYDAVLVGTGLVTAAEPGPALARLLGLED